MMFREISFVVFTVVCLAVRSSAQALPKDFSQFLNSVDAAQVTLQNGNAAVYKALWSTSDDVTLSGGFGGKVEKGWPAVSERLDWAASQFKNGTNTIERISFGANGSIGYIVQIEHIRFRNPAGEATTRDLRVTMVFRKEKKRWRIVHRHADGQTARVPA